MIDKELNLFLGDFGLAVSLPRPDSKYTGRAGTPCYYPYEMVNNMEYDCRADIWCLGVLLVEMLFGILPFKSSSHPITGLKEYGPSISSLKFTLPPNKSVSQDARHLIKKILVP
jgi:serine/threonine protein kinase